MRFVENIRQCNLGIGHVAASDCTRHLVIHNSMSLGLIVDLPANGLASWNFFFKIIIYNPTKPCFKKIWFGAGCVGNQVGMLLIARVSGPLVLADTDRTIDAYKHLSSCNYVKRPKEKRERCVRSRYACTPKREKGGRAPP